MPRLSNERYLVRCRGLRSQWDLSTTIFGYVRPSDQRALHDYFAFVKDLSEAERLSHRKAITATRPALPHRAGRAFARLLHLESQGERGELRNVPRPFPVQPPDWEEFMARPEIQANLQLLARALLNVARRQHTVEHKQAETKDDRHGDVAA
jgi:hypothetical protein